MLPPETKYRKRISFKRFKQTFQKPGIREDKDNLSVPPPPPFFLLTFLSSLLTSFESQVLCPALYLLAHTFHPTFPRVRHVFIGVDFLLAG